MSLYQVKNQWGGESAPWQEGGKWILGSRSEQRPVAVDIQSLDGGETLNGTMSYEGEGSILVQCKRLSANYYQVDNQWGGDDASWHSAGQWIIGFRSEQHIVALNIFSHDQGNTLSGTVTYEGEGPIGFQASCSAGEIYAVKNQWGGISEPWHEGGYWALGCREEQKVISLNITSHDDGKTLLGSIAYAEEGDVAFRGSLIGLNNYHVENQWGGHNAPWHSAGIWVIGYRGKQHVVDLKLSTNGESNTLQGEVSYAGEGPISLRAELVAEHVSEPV